MNADLAAFAERWMLSLTSDLSDYAMFAIGFWLILWVLLGSILASRKIRTEKPPARQLALEFLVSLRSLAIFSTIGALLFMVERAGYLPGPAIAASWGWGWAIASFVLMVIGHDAYFYWTHRLVHDPRLFRTFHRRHHRSHNPSPFTAYSFDVGEAAMQAFFVPIWMFVVPTEWAVVGFFMLHQIVRNTMGHSGYELFPARRDGKPMFDFLTTVTHHDIHHAEARWNYGLYFTWWDRLMGTEHPEYYARFETSTRRMCKLPAAGAKTTVAALLIAVCLIPTEARAQARLHDDWATPGIGGVVRLSPCANATLLCGRLVWVWDAQDVEPGVVGSMILRDFAFENGAWRNGTVTNPEDGRTYRGTINLDGDLLRLRGCAGPFCQNQVWRRLSNSTAMTLRDHSQEPTSHSAGEENGSMTDQNAHWDRVYTEKRAEDVSWRQDEPTLSLKLIRRTGVGHDAKLLDVGGGASTLVDHLFATGFRSLTVLDIAASGLDQSKARLGPQAVSVDWVVSDIRTWRPAQRFRLWHDRAVLHFLTEPADQAAYVETLRSAVDGDGWAIIAGFAPGGPAKCSGLEIVQHDGVSLARLLGDEFQLLETHGEIHVTPWGAEQAFRYHLFRRNASSNAS